MKNGKNIKIKSYKNYLEVIKMNRNKVIIYHSNNIWNWKYWDGYSIPIYGKCFIEKIDAVKDFERFAKFMNIKNYDREDQERDDM